jgi:hypothetical protein
MPHEFLSFFPWVALWNHPRNLKNYSAMNIKSTNHKKYKPSNHTSKKKKMTKWKPFEEHLKGKITPGQLNPENQSFRRIQCVQANYTYNPL